MQNKNPSPLVFFVTYFIPLMTLLGSFLGGFFNYSALFLAFILSPILDLCFVSPSALNKGLSETTPSPFKTQLYQWIVWPHVPLQCGLVIWGAWLISQGTLSWVELVGFTFSVGLSTGGMGISLAHELIHKPTPHERIMGLILLMNVSYMHFYIDHLLGHHLQVGTPEDPTTARQGESLYCFYFRSLIGSYRRAWQIEKKRLSKKGEALWGVKNRMIWFAFWPLLIGMSLTAIWGWKAGLFFVCQSIIAFSLLEAVNYIEHYGLKRSRQPNGHYEKVKVTHSWNANPVIGNISLFMLQYHSDHHAHQSRPYQELEHHEESPQLPTGYAGMLLISLIPPLWHSLMDKKISSYLEPSKNKSE